MVLTENKRQKKGPHGRLKKLEKEMGRVMPILAGLLMIGVLRFSQRTKVENVFHMQKYKIKGEVNPPVILYLKFHTQGQYNIIP